MIVFTLFSNVSINVDPGCRVILPIRARVISALTFLFVLVIRELIVLNVDLGASASPTPIDDE